MSKLKLKGIGPFLPGRDVQWASLMISPPELAVKRIDGERKDLL